MSEMMDQYWPKLELTKEELQFCRAYDGPDFPGVKRRSYFNQLVSTTFTNETSVFQDNFAASGRRTRVFAFTFSGFVAAWQIKMFSTSGELWIQDFTTVTALCNSAPRAASGMQLEIQTGSIDSVLLQQGVIPYRRDPNILLEGTQELVFQGQTLIDPSQEDGRFVLNIGVHVWEFPDIPRGQPRAGAAGGESESMGSAMASKRGR